MYVCVCVYLCVSVKQLKRIRIILGCYWTSTPLRQDNELRGRAVELTCLVCFAFLPGVIHALALKIPSEKYISNTYKTYS